MKKSKINEVDLLKMKVELIENIDDKAKTGSLYTDSFLASWASAPMGKTRALAWSRNLTFVKF